MYVNTCRSQQNRQVTFATTYIFVTRLKLKQEKEKNDVLPSLHLIPTSVSHTREHIKGRRPKRKFPSLWKKAAEKDK